MIYLDYSATTPVNDEVLETFIKVSKDYIGNPNSLHKLGIEAKRLIEASTSQIADILGVNPSEIIYTSGASEANNLAIKGICLKYQNRGKHIITTRLEHSSVIAPIAYLETQGFEVDFVELNEKGKVDLEQLKGLLRDDTILVSINSVNSEVGITQDINKIAKIVKQNPKTFFHSDITQSIGKQKINLSNVDLASISAQKFYGLKGIGCLIKKDNIGLIPLIHGGKSTTIYRSGTPPTALIVSLAKALRLAVIKLDRKIEMVQDKNTYLRRELSSIKEININSTERSIPHILSISISGIKPETMLHALETENIYISTQTACSTNKSLSDAVYAVTKNKNYAQHSLRISLSHLTTEKEIIKFVKVLKQKIKELGALNENYKN